MPQTERYGVLRLSLRDTVLVMVRVIKVAFASLALFAIIATPASGLSRTAVEFIDTSPSNPAPPNTLDSEFNTAEQTARSSSYFETLVGSRAGPGAGARTGLLAASRKARVKKVVAPNTLIRAGDSRAECAELNLQGTGLAAIETAVTSWDALTNSTTNCLLAYLNGAPDWHGWTDAWVTAPQYGYTQWVAQSPTTRQLILQVDLIPTSLQNTNDPLSWEQTCDAGKFNSYATTLGRHLVAAGLGNSVIRLGAEANANWESDFIGNTVREQKAWAKCFDNEVTGLRAASGSHFLIDWNPNACVENIPYNNWYPGNAYVNIMGLDLYDQSCTQWGPAISFTDLSNEPVSLTHFIAYANSRKKPMSIPEWGLVTSDSADDPNYIAGVGATVGANDFAFEAYFDTGAQGTIELSSNTPQSLAAFQEWFGPGTIAASGSR